jgi:ATP-dependent Clp protease ATP-binding subunit ClpA
MEQAGRLRQLTPQARDALFAAEHHARQLRHSTLSPAHLLLAILEDHESLAGRAIDAAGIRVAELARQLRDELPAKVGSESAALPLHPETREALGGALIEAVRLGHNYIGAEHLLLGLIRDPLSHPSVLLWRYGAEAPVIRQHVTRLTDDYPRRTS